MELFGRIEVGADAVLIPRAAQVFRERSGSDAALAEAEVGFAFPVTQNGRLDEGGTPVVRALEPEAETRTSDERVGPDFLAD